MGERVLLLTVGVGLDCNLRCSYCYERHCDAVLSEERLRGWLREAVARFAAEGAFERVAAVRVKLIGGEPFLHVGLLEAAAEELERLRVPVPFGLYVVSNGVLLAHEGAAREFVLRRQGRLEVCFSIDGVKEVHDRFRCGSFDEALAGLRWVRDHAPLCRLSVKMTVCPQGVGEFARGVRLLAGEGVSVIRAAAVDGVVWSAAAGLRWAEALCDVAVWAYEAGAAGRLSVAPLALGDVGKRDGVWCRWGAGSVCEAWGGLSACVGADGRELFCMRFACRPDAPSHKEVEAAMARLDDVLPPECRACPVSRGCVVCPAAMFEAPGGVRGYFERKGRCPAVWGAAFANGFCALARRLHGAFVRRVPRLMVKALSNSDCNLRCSYCYERDRRQGAFDVGRTLGFLRGHLARLMRRGRLERGDVVELYCLGGEPLLYPRALEALFAGFEEVCRSLALGAPVFAVQSNGTLLREADEARELVLRWRWRLRVCVSVDGLPAKHDRDRCGSYEAAVFGVRWCVNVLGREAVSVHGTLRGRDAGDFAAHVGHLSGLGAGRVSLGFVAGEGGLSAAEAARAAVGMSDAVLAGCTGWTELEAEDGWRHLKGARGVRDCGVGTTGRCVGADGRVYGCNRLATDGLRCEGVARGVMQRVPPGCRGCALGAVCAVCPALVLETGRLPAAREGCGATCALWAMRLFAALRRRLGGV